MSAAESVVRAVAEKGDLAHLALLLWASAASFFCLAALKAVGEANRRFDEFVRELARFNNRHTGDDS